MARVSKPMKIITLRIGEEEKARLEQLAERGNVTLSRALREGAALYLHDVQGRLDRARGRNTTWHGVRRDPAGRPLTPVSAATDAELQAIRSLRSEFYEDAFGRIRDAWVGGVDSHVVLAALAGWLNLVGELYAADRSEVGWSWFVRDYCPEYAEQERRDSLRALMLTGVIVDRGVDLSALIQSLAAGFERLLHDVEEQELVRRAVLPAWRVMKGGL